MRVTLNTNTTGSTKIHIKEYRDTLILNRKFLKLFNENSTLKGIEVEFQLRVGEKIIQQKGQPISIHPQPLTEKEFEILNNQDHMEKAKNTDKNCLVSPTVISLIP